MTTADNQQPPPRRLSLQPVNPNQQNQGPVGLTQILKPLAVIGHIIIAAALFIYLWGAWESPMPALLFALVMSVGWVAWILNIEAEKKRQSQAPPPGGGGGPTRFRSPPS